MMASVCFLFVSVSMASGQYVTTTVTTTVSNQIYNQPFYMAGTYINDKTRDCSFWFAPSGGLSLSGGDSITGSVMASAPVYLTIVTTAQVSAKGRVGCANLLRSQFYGASGASFQFEWTAASPSTYYVVLVNWSPNVIVGSLSINQVTSTVGTGTSTGNTETWAL